MRDRDHLSAACEALQTMVSAVADVTEADVTSPAARPAYGAYDAAFESVPEIERIG